MRFPGATHLILLGSEETLVRDAFARAEAFLSESCGLRLNLDSRTFSNEKDGFEFLGFSFRAGRRSISPSKLDQKRARISEVFRKNTCSIEQLVRDLSEMAEGWRSYYGKSSDTREQLLMLEQQFADLLLPWLSRFRRDGAGKKLAAAEIKAQLVELVLPITQDPRRKLKWVESLVARSRPARNTPPDRGLSAAARRGIELRKKEYEKLKLERQEVIVTKPGTYLGRTGERLLIRHDGKRESEIPFTLIRNITLLTKAVSLSGELISESASRQINIVLAGSDGRPAVRIGPPELAEHHLSLVQSTMSASPAGLEIARTIVAGKIRNQANLLRYYLKYPSRRCDGDFLTVGNSAIREIEAVRDTVLQRAFENNLDLERNRLFASEGQAAASYWLAVRCLLWWKPGFECRVRRGATDLVNSLLNYGYGILYSRLLNVLIRTGLNVYVGFLHKPQKGKAGLLYDFIEEFRAGAVDRAVFSLLNLGIEAKVSAEGLDPDTRRELARRVIERLQANTRYHGELISLEAVAEQQARLLVRHLEDKDRYKTWVLPW